MPVSELLARTSSRELTEWLVYERLTGPLDAALRGDIGAAVVAATTVNANGPKRRAKVSDFMPVWFRRKKSPAEIWAEVMKANAALGGSVSPTASERG
jgi:hypothetical protein